MNDDSEDIRRENRLRKKLNRMGYRLIKSRRRDPQAYGYGGYMIINTDINAVVWGANPFSFSLTLDDVESFIRD